MMRHLAISTVILSAAALPAVPAFAGETCHYVNGTEGIKAATLPPPGFYWRSYNVWYTADTITDSQTDDLPFDFDLEVLATTQRFLWITDFKLFGADYGVSAVIPLVSTDLEMKGAGIDDREFGLGDIAVEPLVLAWHGKRYDLSFGAALYVPTGEYSPNKPASPGKDQWTGMFTGGATLYLDAEKTWSASILARYEIHSAKREQNIKAGDDFHFEWGVGKTVAEGWDVGVAGYCHWQVNDDSGTDVTWDPTVRDSVFAIGPEVAGFIPQAGLGLSLRVLWEFEAADRSEGIVSTLTLTKAF
ncbi:MAG: transporter [Phycisphaerales bacterium]|nr:MAG: transporter [Phycisphaerales bacterium]